MIKTHFPDMHEELAKAGPLYTLFDGSKYMTKLASDSSVSKKLSSWLNPPDTHYATHLVAMGDGERYGANKNCFPAGTPVRTPSGFKNIEEVQVGDMVLTHKGNTRPVVYVHKNESCADIVSITTAPDSSLVRMTDEHPVYVLRSDLFCSPDGEVQEELAEFVPARYVRVGDWVHLPLAALDNQPDTQGTGLKKTSTSLWLQIVAVDTQVQATPSTVYNIEVEEDHTYVTLFSVHNCDYWTAEWNQKRAHTFVDHGCYYREHRNMDPVKYGIGEVKAAAYNPDMHRIELVVWGDKRKSEEEYEKIRRGEPLSFSMSARVKGDTCNCCGNYAVNTRRWCKHMKQRPGQFDEETKKYAYVVNDSPTFFDISRVADPADRLAHFISHAYKAASARHDAVLTGVDAAYALGFEQDDSTGFYKLAQNNILDRLVLLEQQVAADNNLVAQYVKLARSIGAPRELDDREMDILRKVKPEQLFAKLASRSCILPFANFVSYVTGKRMAEVYEDSAVKYACVHCMSRLFSNLVGTDCGPAAELLSAGDNPGLLLRGMQGTAESDAIDKVLSNADDIASESSPLNLGGKPVSISITIVRRAAPSLLAIKSAGNIPVSGSTATDASALAGMYGSYIVSALSDMQSLKGDNFVDNIKLQSVISNYA